MGQGPEPNMSSAQTDRGEEGEREREREKTITMQTIGPKLGQPGRHGDQDNNKNFRSGQINNMLLS